MIGGESPYKGKKWSNPLEIPRDYLIYHEAYRWMAVSIHRYDGVKI